MVNRVVVHVKGSPSYDRRQTVTSMSEESPGSGRGSESLTPQSSTGTDLATTDERRVSVRQKSHSPEAWEAVKSDIARLYLDENRRLKDVMTILEEERGFSASIKMYKTKLTQWKFFKNNRREDVASLLHLQHHRQAMGKESSFRRNGKPINLAAYIRRTGLNASDILDATPSGGIPPMVRCGTPPPKLFKRIAAPDDHILQEAYIRWSVDNPLQPPQLEARYFSSLDKYHSGDAMRSVMLLLHGCWLFSIGKVNEGGAFCRQAFQIIDAVLETSAHFAMYELLGSLVRYPDPNILKQLWSYLAVYAAQANKIQVNDRLQRVLRAFAKLARGFSLEHNLDMTQWALRRSSYHDNATFDGRPFDYTLIRPWDLLPLGSSYYHRYYIAQRSWEVDEIPFATIPSLEPYEEPWNLRADLLLILGNQTGWTDDRMSGMAFRMLQEMPAEKAPYYLKFMCLYAMARNNRARCRGAGVKFSSSPDHKLAREYLRRAIEVQREAWGPGKNYYETMTLLETWQLEASERKEAEFTRMRRDIECRKAFEVLLA
ncbi:hypothetical protein GGS20DRAFT_572476 [Poronia punctata]|nr:hypothetical protein GGS20DRAFT_572476 [Poronia punctata]